MIPALLALGIGAFIVMACWDDIVDWLQSVTNAIFETLRHIGHATKIFAKKVVGRMMNIIHRVFYKENNKWYKETTRTEIDESEVPAWAKAGVTQSETDVTQRYQRELSLTL